MKRKVLTTMVPTIPPKAKDSDKDVKPYYYNISPNAIHMHSVTTVYKYTVIALLCLFSWCHTFLLSLVLVHFLLIQWLPSKRLQAYCLTQIYDIFQHKHCLVIQKLAVMYILLTHASSMQELGCIPLTKVANCWKVAVLTLTIGLPCWQTLSTLVSIYTCPLQGPELPLHWGSLNISILLCVLFLIRFHQIERW